jgi:D-alanine-D-alanine ligase
MKNTKTRLALLYNLRIDFPRSKVKSPDDIDADWDIPETIFYLKEGLSEVGYEVIDVGYNKETPKILPSLNALVFNICEMHGGSYRESLVPSLCEIFGLPYVFSTPDVMIKTLDKNFCNFLVRQLEVNTPSWLYLNDINQSAKLSKLKNFPYIVKPAHEGSGIGISNKSIVYSFRELSEQVNFIWGQYQRPVIVQEYIEGLELTIGVVGNGSQTQVLKPIEITLSDSLVYGFQEKENSQTKASYAAYNNKHIELEIEAQSKIIYKGLGCRDAARIDYRFDTKNNRLYFIEINPLPHLHPNIGDFCRSASAAGYSYQELLSAIMDSAKERMKFQ